MRAAYTSSILLSTLLAGSVVRAGFVNDGCDADSWLLQGTTVTYSCPGSRPSIDLNVWCIGVDDGGSLSHGSGYMDRCFDTGEIGGIQGQPSVMQAGCRDSSGNDAGISQIDLNDVLHFDSNGGNLYC